MSEESIDKKNVRLYRWVAAIAMLIVAGGVVWAIRADSDIIAGISCLVLGIALAVLGRGDENPFNAAGKGVVIGIVLFFLWMAGRGKKVVVYIPMHQLIID